MNFLVHQYRNVNPARLMKFIHSKDDPCKKAFDRELYHEKYANNRLANFLLVSAFSFSLNLGCVENKELAFAGQIALLQNSGHCQNF